jgi:hypothetical protein
MKKVVVIIWAVVCACVSTVRADLGQNRFQIEAKYGKQVGYSVPEINDLAPWPARLYFSPASSLLVQRGHPSPHC